MSWSGSALVLCLLGLKSQGTGAFGMVGFCIAFAALAWVSLIRPRVTAHQNGLLLRNMVRDTFLPWATIRAAGRRRRCRSALATRSTTDSGSPSPPGRRVGRQRQRGGQRTMIGPNLGMSSVAAAPTMADSPDDGLIVDKVHAGAHRRQLLLARRAADRDPGPGGRNQDGGQEAEGRVGPDGHRWAASRRPRGRLRLLQLSYQASRLDPRRRGQVGPDGVEATGGGDPRRVDRAIGRVVDRHDHLQVALQLRLGAGRSYDDPPPRGQPVAQAVGRRQRSGRPAEVVDLLHRDSHPTSVVGSRGGGP